MVCELATLTFATPVAAYLLPVGRFGGIWLIVAAVQLPRERQRRPDPVPGLPLVGLAPSGWALFAVLVGYGTADAVTDVSMNVAGVEAQRRLGRPVLNSMHGVWSIGAVLGGFTGSGVAALGVALVLHLGTVAVLCVAVALLAARSVPAVSGEGARGAGEAHSRITPALALLCGLAVMAALVEAAPYSWSTVYLAQHTGASPGTAGLGFTAFVTGMLMARLVADKAVERWGRCSWCGSVGWPVGWPWRSRSRSGERHQASPPSRSWGSGGQPSSRP